MKDERNYHLRHIESKSSYHSRRFAMKYELEEYHRNTPNDKLIADLKRVAADLQKSPTMDEYNERGAYHSSTLCIRFGSWFKALEAASLDKTRSPLNIPEEELFQNLEEVWIKLGRQPRYKEFQKPLSKYSSGTYERRYGSWRNALEKFIAYINEENSSSEEAIKKLEVEPSTRHKTKRCINWRLRFIVMRKDNFKCRTCGRSPATDPSIILHADHIKAWANGGETVLENLQTLCSICNIGKSDLDKYEWFDLKHFFCANLPLLCIRFLTQFSELYWKKLNLILHFFRIQYLDNQFQIRNCSTERNTLLMRIYNT